MLNTIGYEGAKPRDFLQTLLMAEVRVVVDVRDRAQSRRPGFSKAALELSLAEIGIRYIHYRELGDPKEGREAARAKDIAKFKRIFAAVLQTAEANVAMQKIAETCAEESICLLCYERDPAHCHRTMISDKIEIMTGKRARHLGVRYFEQVK
jgi:uncharacterized protein (DUF488 family)